MKLTVFGNIEVKLGEEGHDDGDKATKKVEYGFLVKIL